MIQASLMPKAILRPLSKLALSVTFNLLIGFYSTRYNRVVWQWRKSKKDNMEKQDNIAPFYYLSRFEIQIVTLSMVNERKIKGIPEEMKKISRIYVKSLKDIWIGYKIFITVQLRGYREINSVSPYITYDWELPFIYYL